MKNVSCWRRIPMTSVYSQEYCGFVNKIGKENIYLCGYTIRHTLMESHHYRLRAAKFDLCLALTAIEQLRFIFCDTGYRFIMVISKDLWHSDLLRSVWQWSCHYLFFSTWNCRGCDSYIQPFAFEANALAHGATAVVIMSHECYEKF